MKYKQFFWPVFIVSICTAGQVKSQDLISKKEQINKIIGSYAHANCFTGTVLVAKGDKIFFNQSYGLANRETRTNLTKNSKYFVASLTKGFTAAAIFILQEKGLLDINGPVKKLVPSYPYDNVTVYHLLTHTSGIPDIVRFPDYPDISKKNYHLKDLVTLFWNKPLDFIPGEKSRYSNSNYILLVYIIETISQKSYSVFLSENIFSPLKMDNTGNFESWKPLIHDRAYGYSLKGYADFENSDYYDYTIDIGAGSIYSTSGDLLKWGQALFKNKVIGPESYKVLLPDRKNAIAWKMDSVSNRYCIRASGWDGKGFSSQIAYFPREDITIIALCNLNISSVTDEIVTKTANLIFENNFEPLVLTFNHSKSQNEYAGKFKLGDDFYVPGLELQFTVKGGLLFELQGNGTLMGMLQIGKDEFIHRSSWGRIKFIRGLNGVITGLLFYGRFNAQRE